MKRVLSVVVLLSLAACARSTDSPPPPTPAVATPVVVPTKPAPTPEPTTARVEPTPTTAPTSAPSGERPSFTLDFEPIASGFKRPVYLTHAGDGTGRLFVVEQPGRIWVIENGQLSPSPFLDIISIVHSGGNEQGLLSVAFHPNYESNGLFFVNYTRKPDGATVVARYTVSGDPNAADPNSAVTILTIAQPEPNHNGGLVQFGPDGYLYIGMGDGGGGGDRHGAIGNGQDLLALLGKLLRIDVDSGEPYAIPDSNPFVVRSDVRPEVWAYGLRNPWRFSFDRATGDLFIADVGQNAYEEVNFQPASSAGGENYGWRIMEGNHCFNPKSDCDQSGLVLPAAEYDHGSGCSITGGSVYRGSQYAWLDGLYFFADYCTGIIWSLEHDVSGAWSMVERAQADFTISSFDEDEAGELYVIGHNDGTVYRMTSISP